MAGTYLSGTERLLQHIEALTPRAHVLRPSAYHRLEASVGNDLARLLVAGLTSRPRARAAA
jgi:hypothetical protein